nr:AMP-binding protein [Nitratireductor sp.]
MASRYHVEYESWRKDPEGFWKEAARAVDWIKPPQKVFDPAQGVYGRWFAGATANTCHNCVDRHVERGRGNQPAIIHDSPITGTKRTLTYAELLGEVQALAKVLRDKGVNKGDRVIIYMPMVMEAAVAMLACARLGAIHSVVFGGFAANELATRIDDAKPVLIISASCGIEPGRVIAYKPLLDKAIELASHKVPVTVILQREQQRCDLVAGRDFDYAELAAAARGAQVPCVEVAATDPLYVL